MSQYQFEIGTDTPEFRLLPECERVRVVFQGIEPNKFRDDALRFIFRIDDPEYDEGANEEDTGAILDATEDEHRHYENVNIPKGAVGTRTRLYFFIKGMSGGDYAQGDKVDLEPFLGKTFLADFEHVPAMEPMPDGSFRNRKDDNGNTMMKAKITKIRPVRKKAAAKARKPAKIVEPDIPDDDDDIDFEEEVD